MAEFLSQGEIDILLDIAYQGEYDVEQSYESQINKNYDKYLQNYKLIKIKNKNFRIIEAK